MSQEILERSFSAPGAARLEISNICGSVEIVPGEDGTIDIKAVKRHRSGLESPTEIRMEQAGDGTVVVRTECQEIGLLSFLFKPCKVDYVVRVPKSCHIKASGVSSSISTSQVSGDIHLKTVSGSVHAEELSGQLRLKTVSGDVKASRLTGSLKFESVSGDFRVVNSELDQVGGSTVSGDVRLEAIHHEGIGVDLRTVSGDAYLALTPGTGCSVRFHSLSGDLRTPLPRVDRSRRRKGLIELAGGGMDLRFSSVSGDLVVRYAGESAASPVEETAEEQVPLDTNLSLNRLDILERVEQGYLSVDEAIGLLQ